MQLAAFGLISITLMRCGQNATAQDKMNGETANIRVMKQKCKWNSIGTLKHA